MSKRHKHFDFNILRRLLPLDRLARSADFLARVRDSHNGLGSPCYALILESQEIGTTPEKGSSE